MAVPPNFCEITLNGKVVMRENADDPSSFVVYNSTLLLLTNTFQANLATAVQLMKDQW